MTALTPEKRADWRKELLAGIRQMEAAGDSAVFAKPLIESNRLVLSLLDALEAAERDFARLAQLGNLVRSRSTAEQDEMNALLRKAKR